MEDTWHSIGRFPFQEVSASQILDTEMAMPEKNDAYGLCSVLIQQSWEEGLFSWFLLSWCLIEAQDSST